MEFCQRFNQIFKSKKKSQKMTQADLASRMSVSEASISAWLSGKSMPGIKSIEKLAKILNVPTSLLLGDKQNGDLSKEDYEFSLLTDPEKKLLLILKANNKDLNNVDYDRLNLAIRITNILDKNRISSDEAEQMICLLRAIKNSKNSTVEKMLMILNEIQE